MIRRLKGIFHHPEEEQIVIVVRRSGLLNDDGTPISDEIWGKIVADVKRNVLELNQDAISDDDSEENIRG